VSAEGVIPDHSNPLFDGTVFTPEPRNGGRQKRGEGFRLAGFATRSSPERFGRGRPFAAVTTKGAIGRQNTPESSGLGHEPRTQAAGANPDMRADTVNLGVNTLKVGALNALGLPVGMADLILNDAAFAAECTLSWHGCSEGAYV
jgi:hypothetical protein